MTSRTAEHTVTLRILGKPLTFGSRIEGCLPPHVPVPKPGPCPGARKAGGTVRKAARAVAKKPGKAGPGRATGSDISGSLDYETIAAQRAGYHKDFDRSDQQFTAIAKAQGFDGKPQKASDAGLDALVKSGGIELWRGISHQRDDQNRVRKRARTLVKQFRDGVSGVIRAVLAPDAHIADYQVAFDAAEREGNAAEREVRQRQLFEDLKGKPLEQKRAIRRAYNDWLETRPAREKVLGDMGRWAAAHGYDAIRVTETFPNRHTYVVVLNRSALTTTQ